AIRAATKQPADARRDVDRQDVGVRIEAREPLRDGTFAASDLEDAARGRDPIADLARIGVDVDEDRPIERGDAMLVAAKGATSGGTGRHYRPPAGRARTRGMRRSTMREQCR